MALGAAATLVLVFKEMSSRIQHLVSRILKPDTSFFILYLYTFLFKILYDRDE